MYAYCEANPLSHTDPEGLDRGGGVGLPPPSGGRISGTVHQTGRLTFITYTLETAIPQWTLWCSTVYRLRKIPTTMGKGPLCWEKVSRVCSVAVGKPLRKITIGVVMMPAPPNWVAMHPGDAIKISINEYGGMGSVAGRTVWMHPGSGTGFAVLGNDPETRHERWRNLPPSPVLTELPNCDDYEPEPCDVANPMNR